jgi:AraC family transcriptional regulator
VNSENNPNRFTSELFTKDGVQKCFPQAMSDRPPSVQTGQLPDTSFKRAIGEQISLEHRYHHPANEVPETQTVNAGLVINLGKQYQLERWIDGRFCHDQMQTGDFTVFPADIAYRVAWDKPLEILMVGFDPSLIQQTALELNDYEKLKLAPNGGLEIFPKDKLHDPLIYQIGLALKCH